MSQNEGVNDVARAPELCHHDTERDQGESAKAVDGLKEPNNSPPNEVDIGLWERRPPKETGFRFLQPCDPGVPHVVKVERRMAPGQPFSS